MVPYRHTEEIKRKIGLIHKGKIVSIETRLKLKLVNTGRKASPELRKKLSKIHKQSGRFIKSKNISWKGYWVTPIGKYEIAEDASKELGISKMLLMRLCKSTNITPLTNWGICKNRYLLKINAVKGQTPRELGFGFRGIK